MLTPSFILGQTDSHVSLTVSAPLANIAQTELTVVDNVIIFYSSPYYLRLHLPGNVFEVEGETGKYSPETQEFSFILKKLTTGEHFEDLDLIGKLLVPNKKYQLKPEITVCNEDEVAGSDAESEEELLGYIKQEIVRDEGSDLTGYGFANKGYGIGKQLRYEFREILDFVDLENTVVDERSVLRKADEQSKFSEEHYLADLMESEEIHSLISWRPDFPNSVKFTPEEKELLKKLGSRDYLLNTEEKKVAVLSLVDILFAYAYNERTTLGEETVESAWTINKVSGTLSWLQSFNSMAEVKTACARRSLIFPLYRHWDLTLEVFNDTLNILKMGRRQIVKCFLSIYKMFAKSEPRYLLNELYISDYCIWIQQISENSIRRLADEFEEVVLTMDDVGLELRELGEAALMVQAEVEELTISKGLLDIKLAPREEGNSDEEDCDSSEDSDSGSSSSTIDSDDLSSEEE